MQVYVGHRLTAGMSINYKKNTRSMLSVLMIKHTCRFRHSHYHVVPVFFCRKNEINVGLMQVYVGHRLTAGMSINYKKNTRSMLDQRMFIRSKQYEIATCTNEQLRNTRTMWNHIPASYILSQMLYSKT